MNSIELSIIIVNWNTRQLLLNCIASIYRSINQPPLEIIVVDNGSTDGSVEALTKTYPQVWIISNAANLGFAAANNGGIRQMKGRYAVLLNSDTLLKQDTLQKMFSFMEQNPRAGMCGPQLLNEDGSLQNSTGNFPTLLSEFVSKKVIRILFPGRYKQIFKRVNESFEGPRVVDYIVGACMMVRKTAMDEAGAMDADYFFLLEEVDWCRRMHNSGWPVYHLPDVAIYHLGGQSMKEINLRARVEYWRSRYLYFKKSLNLSVSGQKALLLLGFSQNAYHFFIYSLLNILTVYSVKRLRRRWMMFLYLLVWHLRGRPVSMGIPR